MPRISASPAKSSQVAPKKTLTRSKFNKDGSEKGATCHQCHQMRSVNLVIACTVIKPKRGLCPIKLCYRCLLNRYGEKTLLDDWQCPKCRGICNCSACRIRQGQKPTGILTHRARESGYASVSDLLTEKGADNEEIVEEKENTTPDKEQMNGNGLLELSNGDMDANACPVENIKPKKKYKKKDTSNSSNGINPNDVGVKGKAESKKKRKLNADVEIVEPEVEMPKGTDLTALGGVELLPEEVGDALQFIEFCAAFAEVLAIKKGQAESIIRELTRGKRRKCGQYSSLLVQIHINLLSLIQKDMGIRSPSLSSGTGKNSWLQALGELASESLNLLKDFQSDWFDRGAAGYEMLDNGQKLKLLNFLCDEAVSTQDLKMWIDEQHFSFTENEKEAKNRVSAAKDKVKELKKKLKNEKSQALIGENAQTSENEAAIAELRCEMDEARAERLEAEGALSKRKQKSDVLRTEPVLLDDINGCVFWRLKSHTDEPDVLLQDFGAWDSAAPHEKWFAFKEEQKQDILKYLSSSSMSVSSNFLSPWRKKRVIAPKTPNPPENGHSETT